jgi:hypothetical protein
LANTIGDAAQRLSAPKSAREETVIFSVLFIGMLFLILDFLCVMHTQAGVIPLNLG